MATIDGLGGAFVFSNDPKRLADWYAEQLGMEFQGSAELGSYYQIFWGLDPEEPARKMDTTFAIMRAKVELPRRDDDAPETDDMYGDQPFMVNLRVRDLDAVLEHLAAKGTEPLKREDEEYGRFAWIRDADGNRVELYQPVVPDAA